MGRLGKRPDRLGVVGNRDASCDRPWLALTSHDGSGKNSVNSGALKQWEDCTHTLSCNVPQSTLLSQVLTAAEYTVAMSRNYAEILEESETMGVVHNK